MFINIEYANYTKKNISLSIQKIRVFPACGYFLNSCQAPLPANTQTTVKVEAPGALEEEINLGAG